MKLVSESLRDFLVAFVRETGVVDEASIADCSEDRVEEPPPGYAVQKEVYRLFGQLPAEIDGAPAGLALAEAFEPSGLGLALRIACHRGTLGEAITTYFGFQELVHPRFTYLEREVDEEGCAAVVVEPQDFRLAAVTREVRTVFQSALAVQCYRGLVGDASITPVAVEFMKVTPEFHSAYEAHFQAPVSENPSRGRLVLDEALLERRVAAADEGAFPYLRELGEIRRDELADYARQEGGLVEKVRTYLVHILGVESTGQQEAARYLGMSQRTMRRRLKEQGYEYGELVRAVRERKARDLLKFSTLSHQEIARELGYSRASSFYRAFKRWTGQTPTDFRERSGSEASDG